MSYQHVQFAAFATKVQWGERRRADLIGNNLGLTMDDFPWRIPDGKVFRITDMGLGSKHIVPSGTTERSSYMDVLAGDAPDQLLHIRMITDRGPNMDMNRYIELPGGYYFAISFANSSPEEQNMNGLVVGYLTEAPNRLLAMVRGRNRVGFVGGPKEGEF